MAIEVKLVNYTLDPVHAIALAASSCYDADPSSGLVERCIKSGHESVVEFAVFHFEISRISRVCSHQLVRHRLASYAQQSQLKEYHGSFVIPPSIAKDNYLVQRYRWAIEDVQRIYNLLIENGVPPGDARYILPNAAETKIHVAMNFRELLHFCEQRLCNRAQWEIREVAQEMKRLVTEVSPLLGDYLVPKCERYGCREERPCGMRVSTTTQRIPA